MAAIDVAHSIFDARALQVQLEGLFEDIPKFDNCYLYRSYSNDTYKLHAGTRRYYLRVYRAGWRTSTQVRAEIEIVEAVFGRGGKVARAVPLLEGGYVLELDAPEGPRCAVLFGEAAGTALAFGGTDAVANARIYGRSVGELHLAMEGLPKHPDRPVWMFEENLDWPLRIIEPMVALDCRADLRRLISTVRERIVTFPDLTIGMCHGDLSPSNILVADGSATVLDFENSSWGWLANDVAAFARGLTRFRSPGEEVDALIGAYLAGYRSVKIIPSSDFEALPIFFLVQHLCLAAWFVRWRHRLGAHSLGASYVAEFSKVLEVWSSILTERPKWG